MAIANLKLAVENEVDEELSREKVQQFLAQIFSGKSVNKILLINPPDGDEELFKLSTARRKRYPIYPPYGLLVIASRLRRLGVEVEVIDLNYEVLKSANLSDGKNKFVYKTAWQVPLNTSIEAFKPDLIGLSCMFTMTHSSLKQVSEYLGRLTETPQLVGGVHVTNDLNRVMDDLCDVKMAVLHEGDIAFENLISFINNGCVDGELTQLVLSKYVAKTDNHIHIKSVNNPSAIDTNIIPAYDLISLDQYSSYGTIGAFYCFNLNNIEVLMPVLLTLKSYFHILKFL